jgi:hypothetical protein
MAQLKLTEIAQWTEKQRKLYADYYQELWQVKSLLSSFARVRQVMDLQVCLVGEYQRAFALFQQDRHFTPKEIAHMHRVYSGMLGESVRNLDALLLVVNAFSTQMSDAQRLEIIHRAAEGMEQTYADLRAFNRQNIGLSLARAKDAQELETFRTLYGLTHE